MNLETKNQILILIAISLVTSFTFNFFRPSGEIDYIAVPLPNSDEESVYAIMTEPKVSTIDLELAKKLHSEGIIFVDARSEDYLIEGFIPGAIYDDDFESLATKINNIVDVNKPFVVYCSDDECGSSEELAYELQEWGFTNPKFHNILVFKGGWRSWSQAGLEIQYFE